jgi:aspartate/methionine/tyrosine aminotransferase
MSKAHNMPGWRIGMLASNPQFVQWVLTVKSNVDSGQLHALQLAAAEALNAGQDWYDQINSVYRQRRKVAEQIMTAIGCTFDPEQVGLFLWGKIQNENINAEQLCDQILYNADVFVTPGFIFGAEGKQFVRLSLCCDEKILQEALQRIQQSNITFSDGRYRIKSGMTQPSIPLCEHVYSGLSMKPTSGSPLLHSTNSYQIN